MLTCRLDLDFYRGNVARTINTIQVGVLTATRKAAIEGAQYAKKVGAFQDRTGKLRDRIYPKYMSGNANGSKWMIISPAKYSVFIEQGTKRHYIKPKDKSVLRWVNPGGGVVFSKIVNHPGNRPYKFMASTLVKAKTILWREINATLNKVDRIWDAK